MFGVRFVAYVCGWLGDAAVWPRSGEASFPYGPGCLILVVPLDRSYLLLTLSDHKVQARCQAGKFRNRYAS